MRTFYPDFQIHAQMPAFTEEDVRREPMLFAADRAFALANGGPITRAFIETLPCRANEFRCPPDKWVIDSKVVMLMKGMFPCIPGWHHDDVPRTRQDGQPDYDNPPYRAEHFMALAGDASLTEFVAEAVEVPEVPLGRTVYQVWDRYLEALCPKTVQIHPGVVVMFSWRAFHRGARATKAGWRFFIRATRYTERPVRNEIRTQVQVYLDDPSLGW